MKSTEGARETEASWCRNVRAIHRNCERERKCNSASRRRSRAHPLTDHRPLTATSSENRLLTSRRSAKIADADVSTFCNVQLNYGPLLPRQNNINQADNYGQVLCGYVCSGLIPRHTVSVRQQRWSYPVWMTAKAVFALS